MALQDEELSSQVIRAAINVHRTLGPGFLESIYEAALCVELDADHIPYERQKTLRLTYREKSIGEHRLDLLIDGRLVLELKATKDLDPIYFATVRSYLKASNLESGLLINFSAMPLTVKRIGREWVPRQTSNQVFWNNPAKGSLQAGHPDEKSG